MKKSFLTIITMFLPVSVLSAQWKFHERNYAKLEAKSQAQIQQLINQDIIIDKPEGTTVYIYVSESELAELRSQGFEVSFIPDPAKEYADRLWESTK